jgi:flagellar biosynthesis/type III secretory pathway chaperone
MEENNPEVGETEVALKDVMNREIRILRELLGSIYEEQQAHLTNNINGLKELQTQREQLLQKMANERETRLVLVSRLYELLTDGAQGSSSLDEHECLDILTEHASSESCEILMLRDQMIALIDQMTEQGNRNNYLLEGKISHTKELLQRIHPPNPNTTYGASGHMKKTKVKTKIRIINQEV